MVSPFEEGICHLPIFLLCVPIVCYPQMSGMSITYSGYWYPPSPDNSLHNKTQNLYSEPIHLEWHIQAMLPSKNSIIMEYGSSSFKIMEQKQWKKKKDKTHTSTQESWNKGLK